MSGLKQKVTTLLGIVGVLAVFFGLVYFIVGKSQAGVNLLVQHILPDNIKVYSAEGNLLEGFSFKSIHLESKNHSLSLLDGSIEYDNLLNIVMEDQWILQNFECEKAIVKFKKSKQSIVEMVDFNKSDWGQFVANLNEVIGYAPADLKIENLVVGSIEIYDRTEKLVSEVSELTLEGIVFKESSFNIRRYVVMSNFLDFWGLDARITNDLTFDLKRKMVGRVKPGLISTIDRVVGFDLRGMIKGLSNSSLIAHIEGDAVSIELNQNNLKMKFNKFVPVFLSTSAPPFAAINGEVSTDDFPRVSYLNSKLSVEYSNLTFISGIGDLRVASDRIPFEEMLSKRINNPLKQGIPLFYKAPDLVFEMRFSPRHLYVYDNLSDAFLMRSNGQFPDVKETLSEFFYRKRYGNLTSAQRASVDSQSERFHKMSDFNTSFGRVARKFEDTASRGTASENGSESSSTQN